MTTTVPDTRNDEATLRKMMHDWSMALEAKDPDGLVAAYLPETVLYDAIPPYKTVGKDAIKTVWSHCLPYFPASFKSEHRDVVFHVSGDVAFAHGVHHFVTVPADDPCGKSWMRVSVGYKRIHGEWKVLHEHVSLPFNPMNNQAWNITNPDVLDVPDYTGCV
jgi:ketosteroid isomerase-like protein